MKKSSGNYRRRKNTEESVSGQIPQAHNDYDAKVLIVDEIESVRQASSSDGDESRVGDRRSFVIADPDDESTLEEESDLEDESDFEDLSLKEEKEIPVIVISDTDDDIDSETPSGVGILEKVIENNFVPSKKSNFTSLQIALNKIVTKECDTISFKGQITTNAGTASETCSLYSRDPNGEILTGDDIQNQVTGEAVALIQWDTGRKYLFCDNINTSPAHNTSSATAGLEQTVRISNASSGNTKEGISLRRVTNGSIESFYDSSATTPTSETSNDNFDVNPIPAENVDYNFVERQPLSKCQESFKLKSSRFDLGGYECDFCLMRFSHPGYLRSHLPLHSFYKMYQCKGCRQCFAEKRQLYQHTRSIKASAPPEENKLSY